MKFYANSKWYTANVKEAFENATLNDYDYDIEENGVKLNGLADASDFNDCVGVWLYYNPSNGKITIQLAKDDYEIITRVLLSEEEKILIKTKLSD